MMQQQEQPLTVESLKRILANHDERLSRLENDKKAYRFDESGQRRRGSYAKISYGYFMQKLAIDPAFPASVGTQKKNARKVSCGRCNCVF